ncbi:hypothetical protein [Streptomyces sp. P17]|uniref:hypothetical protein n=1 Tax=Streptomyces sp. P17 TaxID=3074716 RepID=UPI0028F40541|nr:hypothetical protein [Streptomyces sp. P17]MDT9698108.1 hypothetical protein [Streptomyces sp. P17]
MDGLMESKTEDGAVAVVEGIGLARRPGGPVPRGPPRSPAICSRRCTPAGPGRPW